MIEAQAPQVTADGPRGASLADAPIEAALQRSMPDVSFDNLPLYRVLELLNETMGVNMHVRWRVIEEAGVARDLPISMRLKNLPVERVLRLVLDESAETRLGFMVEDGVLIVSTRENLSGRQRVELYDVQDLIESLLHGRRGGVRVDPATGAWSESPEADSPASASRLKESLIATITNAVEPDAWMMNGGIGSISIVGRTLVVRQSDHVHRELRVLLAELRQVTASQLSAK